MEKDKTVGKILFYYFILKSFIWAPSADVKSSQGNPPAGFLCILREPELPGSQVQWLLV